MSFWVFINKLLFWRLSPPLLPKLSSHPFSLLQLFQRIVRKFYNSSANVTAVRTFIHLSSTTTQPQMNPATSTLRTDFRQNKGPALR